MTKKTKTKITADTPELFKDRGAPREARAYEFMPATIDTVDKGGTIGVKYETNATVGYDKVGAHTIMRYPDRTLYVFRSMIPSNERLNNVAVDETVELDVFLNKSLLGEMGFKYSMVNASAVSTKYRYENYDAEVKKPWPLIVADSGGFQLHSGAADFLDPHDIVANHSKVADIGIVLDIPLPLKFHKYWLLRSAKIQKRNTEIFLKDKRPSLDFLNVFHGATFYMRDKYREHVEIDEMNRVAIGGLKTADLLSLVLHILFVVLRGKKYEQYHVLGVSGLERWIALAYIGHKKIAKLITSDSSSYMACGVKNWYFEPQRLQSTIDLGKYSWTTNNQRLLNCGCPVCSTTKYVSALADIKSTIGFRGVIMHNLFLSRAYLDEIWDLCSHSKSEILTYLRPYFTPAKIKEIGFALQAIDVALQDGPEVAAAKYAPQLLEKYAGGEKKGLFAKVNEEQDKKAYAKFDKLLAKYEKFHGMKVSAE